MSFDDLKLNTKTLIPLTGMALVFTAVIGVGVVKLNGLTQRYGEITSSVDPAILRLNRATRVANEMGRDVYGIVVYDPTDARAKAVASNYAAAKATGDQAFDEAISLNPTKADQYRTFKDRFDALYEETKAPKAIGDEIPGLAAGSKLSPNDLDKMAVASREMEQLDADINDFAEQVQTYNHAIEHENDASVTALKQESGQTIAMMIGLGLVSILGGLGIAAWVSSAKVARPLVRLGDRMRQLAQGELTVEVEGQNRRDEVGAMAKAVQVFKDNALKTKALEAEAADQRRSADEARERGEVERARVAELQAQVVGDLATGLSRLASGVLTFRLSEPFSAEYEKLRSDFNAAMEQLQDTMKIVSANTAAIRSGTGEITQASDDLSRRTEQQAASLEETAAALDEITATVRKTASGAGEARDVVSQAKTDAEHSGAVVREAVSAMAEIETSAQQISQIIGVIDEIAFQTNLLALNAGVEAARAGDAGKGFAVVASEVRALAQRSAEAAKEIKALISASSQQVDKGVNLVGETGKALERIVTQVAQINGVVAEIAASAQEQATGLQQVNTAVNQMDQVTQQNAAMVEESTAAAHALAQETEELARLIGRFEVGEEARVQPIGQRKPAPQRTRTALKTTGRGGAAPRPEPAHDEQTWDEF